MSEEQPKIRKETGQKINTEYKDIFDEKVREENLDYLQTQREQSPEIVLEKKRLTELLINSMAEVLTKQERDVLLLRFYDGMTLKETGKALSIPVIGEKVRQIQAKALRKIRRSPQAELLFPFSKEDSH
jgi:RNA polymerase sigma factor (sigma-70 family)